MVRIISRARRRKAQRSRYVLDLPVTLLIMIVPVVYWQRNFFCLFLGVSEHGVFGKGQFAGQA